MSLFLDAFIYKIHRVVCVWLSISGTQSNRDRPFRVYSSQSKVTCLYLVAVTANAMTDERALCLSAGMQDYLIKPLDRTGLYACMNKWLSLR